jgi:RHS repeat-associated protein
MAVQGYVGLSYHSTEVNHRPLVETVLLTDPLDPLPTEIKVQLTWNNGAPQSWVTFSTSGHSPGDQYLLAAQVATAVTSTGFYPWTLQVQLVYPGPDEDLFLSGTTPVVVRDADYGSYLGHGWALAGLDRLVVHTSGGSEQGVLLVYGVGGSRYFTRQGDGSYLSPDDEFGTMVKNVDNSYTYTDKHQTKWNFSSTGYLQTVKDPHNLTLTYAYTSNKLSTLTAPDSGITTFSYDAISGWMNKITLPGNRVMTLTHNAAGDLTGVQESDGSLRTMSYDSVHRLTNDRWGPRNTTYGYDTTTGLLNSIDSGQSTVYTITAANARGLQTSPARSASQQGIATLVDPLSRTTTYTFNFGGYLTQIQTPDGATQTWQRDAHDQVAASTDGLGRRTVFTYNYGTGKGDLVRITHPDGTAVSLAYDSTFHYVSKIQDTLDRLTTLTYNSTADLTKIQDALGQVTTLVWASGLLQSVTNPRTYTTTLQHDSTKRRLEAIIDADNKRTTFTYSSALAIKDARNNVTTLTYNGRDQLITLQNAANGQATFAYNAPGDLTSQTNPRGYRTDYSYQTGRGWLETIIEAAGTAVQRTTTLVYNAAGEVTSIIDPRGNRTTFTYDLVNRRLAQVNPVNGIETFVYDAAWQLQSYTNPVNRITTFTFNNRGWLTEVRDPLNQRVTYGYDTEGNLTSVVNKRSYSTSLTYDALNRVTQVVEAVGQAVERTTTISYDANSNVRSITNPRNFITSFAYDALDRTTQVIEAFGATGLQRTTTFGYDAVHNLTGVTDPELYKTTYTYDALNRLETARAPDNGVATWVYDANSNVSKFIDQLGKTTTLVYDALDRNTEVIDPRSGSTVVVYDANDNVTTVIDPVGNRTTFVYDAANRRTQATNPLNKNTTYAYDVAHRLTSMTDRLGRRRDFGYDELDRNTTEKWYAAGGSLVQTLTYTYDANNNLLTAQDPDGLYTLTYDPLDRVDTVKAPFSQVLTFTYDAMDNRTKVLDSKGGITTSTYDGLDRLTKREFTGTGGSPARIDLTYTPRDQVATLTYYRDLAGTQKAGSTLSTYDGNQRMQNRKHRDATDTVFSNTTYTYDKANRLETEVVNGTTTSFTYDLTDQLTGATGGRTESYGYDLNGNRNTTGYVTGTGNRMTSDGTWTYVYDDAGNITKKTKGASLETWTYGYDHRNQLVWAEKRATDGGTLQMRADYKYDALGNRLEKAVDPDGTGGAGTTTTRFAYDGTEVWADLDGSNGLAVRYIRGDGIDQLFARETPGPNGAWYFTDRLGSVQQLRDLSSGTVHRQLTYDSYGNILSDSNSSYSERHLWTGREFDTETGWQLNDARYYLPTVGRWSTEDPIGFDAGDPNLYRYVFNAPLAFTDPSGEGIFEWIAELLTPSNEEERRRPVISLHDRTSNWEQHADIRVFNGRTTAPWAQQNIDQLSRDYMYYSAGVGLGAGGARGRLPPRGGGGGGQRGARPPGAAPTNPPRGNTSFSKPLPGMGSGVHPSLPPRTGRQTQGIFSHGGVEVQLESKVKGPGQSLASLPGLDFKARTALSHVEGHAAAVMRQHGIMEADLYINYVGGPCPVYCQPSIPSLLPPGAKLRVHYPKPDGSVGVGIFVGGKPGFQILK